VEGVVAGVSAGCRENGASLIGGETAEMPGVYTPPDYDLAGFVVGCMEEDEVITSAGVKDGDVLVGLASTGLHTNGYSLARHIVTERMKLGVHDVFPESGGKSVADVMLAVHRSYLNVLGPALGRIHAMAHITGGGIPGNLDRALPPHLDAVVETGAWDIPAHFRVLEEAGKVDRAEMYRAFNMGVGMIVIADTVGAAAVRDLATRAGVESWTIGHTRPGSGRVHLV
jgi:phosphoribosylformylglycinamidine cyclo-ligase